MKKARQLGKPKQWLLSYYTMSDYFYSSKIYYKRSGYPLFNLPTQAFNISLRQIL